MKLIKNISSQLNEKINEMTQTHQSVVSQKDKLLADYQKQVELLQKTETELTKQIEEQKGKNNVSCPPPAATFALHTSLHPIFISFFC